MIELPYGWAAAPIEELRAPELNSITDGPYGSSLKTDHYRANGARVIRLGNIGSREFLNGDAAYISEDHFRSLAKHRVMGGDILVAALGDPVGRACLAPRDVGSALVKADCFRVRLSPELSPRLLMLWLNSDYARTAFAKAAHGLGRVRINLSDLRTILVPIPPRPEQERIVTKFDRLSAGCRRARDHLDHIPRLVKNYKQSLLAAAFRGNVTREWRAFISRTGSWESTTIGRVLTDVRYGTAKKCRYDGGAVGVLRIPNVQQGRVTLEDVKSGDFNESELETLRLEDGDILVIRSNGSLDLVGRSAIVHQAAVGMLFAGYLIRFRLDRGLADPRFIQLYLQTAEVRTLLERLAKSTSGVHNINSTQLKGLALMRPDVDEQREIVRRVESAFAWIDRLATETTSARKLIDDLDQAILAKAFRGELTPQDPNDEPASVLLERIRASWQATPARSGGRGRARASCVTSRTV
jgi:type I restriction enzyme S subunit